MSEAGDLRAISALVEMVETYFGLPADSIRAHSRAAPLTEPRMIVMYLARVELGLTLERTAAGLNRDHSTIYHGAAVVLRSKRLWYLRDVVRGRECFIPLRPSIDLIGHTVAAHFETAPETLRGPTKTYHLNRARNTMLWVSDQFNMVPTACVYLNRRRNWADRVLERPGDSLLTNYLTNQVRIKHGAQQEHWAVSGRRYCLGRGREERRSPLPVTD